MIRLIKRYESRKLYDTEESRYVSLDDIAAWIRDGQEVKIVDNATAADVTSQTLTQIIVEEGRKGSAPLPSELLHDLVRFGERTVTSGFDQVQTQVGKLVGRSIDRLSPVRQAREEMSVLRGRLEQLEASLTGLERSGAATPPAAEPPPPPAAKPRAKRKAPASGAAARKSTGKSTAKSGGKSSG